MWKNDTMMNAHMHSYCEVWQQIVRDKPSEPTDYSNMGYLWIEENTLSVDL